MDRRGQSLVEFAVCLPFLLLLMGAMADFGWNLHRQQLLVGVARHGASALAGHPAPDPPTVARLRRELAFAGQALGLGLDGVAIGPVPAEPGRWAIELRVPRVEISPVAWSGPFAGAIEVRLVAPVGSAP